MKFQLNLVKSILAVAGVAAVSAVSAAPASAFSFGNIAGGDTVGDNYLNSFSFNVTQTSASSVLFNILNSGNSAAPNMFIGGVFFDDGGLLSNGAAVNNSTAAFGSDQGSGNLPQGNIVGFTTDHSFFSNNGGGNKWGVQGGESIGFSFAGNYNNVVSALNSGSLKLGLHVQSLPGRGATSDSYISSTSNTEATPEPLTMLAAGAAVGFGTMFKKQRAQAQKAQ
ncbi:PEP-CTERM sorting domain-containing protein [Microcoleus sp. AT9b-C3]